jgi:hypothetical protein
MTSSLCRVVIITYRTKLSNTIVLALQNMRNDKLEVELLWRK